jgi:hypothetical protein
MDLMRLISKRGWVPNITDKNGQRIYIPEDIINIIKDYINRPVYAVRIDTYDYDKNKGTQYVYFVYGLCQRDIDKEKLLRPIPMIVPRTYRSTWDPVKKCGEHSVFYDKIIHLNYFEIALVNDDREFLCSGCYHPINIICDELGQINDYLKSICPPPNSKETSYGDDGFHKCKSGE